MIAEIFMIMWIPQLMSCGSFTIMVRAAVATGRAAAATGHYG